MSNDRKTKQKEIVDSLVRPVQSAFDPDERKTTMVLCVSVATMIVWKYFGTHETYAKILEAYPRLVLWNDPQATAGIYVLLSFAVLLGLIPFLFVRFRFRESPSDYGVCLGQLDTLAWVCIIGVPIFLLVGYLSAAGPALRAEYPINKSADNSPSMFMIHIATYLIYYAAFEFHFRGFLQFGLRERFGTSGSVLTAAMAATLIHIGKPWSETSGAFFASVLWGMLAYRSRSLLSGLILHASLGIMLDFTICWL